MRLDRVIVLACIMLVAPALEANAAGGRRKAKEAPVIVAGPGGPASVPAGGPAAQSQPATSQAAGTQPAGSQPAASQPGATQPAVKLVPLSFKEAPLDQIARFLFEQMGKPVLIDKGVEKVRVTVINPKPLPASEAMEVLMIALQEQGVAIEERQRTVHLVPVEQMVRRELETVPASVDVATVRPISKIVRKVFELKYYDPSRLVDALKQMLPPYCNIIADPSSRKLIVIGPVERLITISRVIEELDKADVSGGELHEYIIKNVDVYELVPYLQKLIARYLQVDEKAISAMAGGVAEKGGGPRPQEGRPEGMEGRPDMRGGRPEGKAEGGKPAEIGAVTITGEKYAVLLIPEPRRSSIVVMAPAKLQDQIKVWLETLDQVKPPQTQWEIVEVKYGDAAELAEQLTTMLSRLPDDSLRSSVRISPFASSRRLIITGSDQSRELILTWLKDIDIQDFGTRKTQTFILKYADAEKVAQNIKDLFGQEDSSRRFYGYGGPYGGGGGGGGSDRNKVTVSANVQSNSVTVNASPEKMKRIEDQIKEWDKPFDGEDVAPLIITLKYADPSKTKDLLENLFSQKEKKATPWWDWDEEDGSKDTYVAAGRLFGLFRFEAYPDTGKLVVVTKNPENYEVIKKLVAQLDQPQEAGLPRTIQLKFADAETVAEQLNALLNAPGTPTSIQRRGRLKGFEQFSDDRSPYNRTQQANAQPRQQQQDQQQDQQGTMRFWWQEPPNPEIKGRQPSNLVGKLRIVPNIERNVLLVAAPEEYTAAVDKLVEELDRPGYQVLIRAVIAEATLDDSMSLGFRFSADKTAFLTGDEADNALRGLFSYQFKDTTGNGTHTFQVNTDIVGLLSLLGKVTQLSIKSEPKILTADNVEAEFFDGQDIPFISNTQITDVGSQTQSFDYFPVGITLRVRPHITQEKEERAINLTVKLRVSSVVPGKTLFGGALVDRRETTTQITLVDGRTFIISGILRQQDTQVIRRIPGLGDIPGLGEIFTHRETAKVNTELLVFLTPYVIGPKPQSPESDPIETEPNERLQKWDNPAIGDRQGPARPTVEIEKPTAGATSQPAVMSSERRQQRDNPIVEEPLGPARPTVALEKPADKTTSQPAVEQESGNADHG